MSILRAGIKILILLLSLLWAGSGWAINLTFEVSDTTPAKGGTATATVTCLDCDGTPNLYIDWGDPSTDGSKLGDWISAGRIIAYDSSLNDADGTYTTGNHTFNAYGEFEVTAYVIDDSSNEAWSMILVNVEVGGTTIDPTSAGDCGANIISTSDSDCSPELQACVNGQTGAVTVQFPPGTYRFDSTMTLGGATATDIQLEALTPGTVTIETNVAAASSKLLTALGTDTNIYIKHLYFKHLRDITLGGSEDNKPNLFQALQVQFTGSVVFQYCTFEDYIRFGMSLSSTTIKCNFINGGASEVTHPNVYASSDTYQFTKWIYFSSNRNHENFYYSDDGLYFIGNYIYAADDAQDFFLNSLSDKNYLYQNYIDRGNASQGFMAFKSTADEVEILDNYITYSTGNAKITVGGGDGVGASVLVDGNIFWSGASPSQVIALGGADLSNVTISNNIFGENIGDAYWDFLGTAACGPGTDPDCNAACEDNVDPSSCSGDGGDNDCDCNGEVTFTSNTSNSTAYDISDPGSWEFNSPNLCYVGISGNTVTIDASDGGSGLGATARWPLEKASMVQALYSDGSYSQVEDYASSVTFTPPGAETISSVAVWDVDHNISTWRGAGEWCGRTVRGVTLIGVTQ